MFKLVIQDDEGKTTVVPLIRDEITIGRKEGNTIRLTERNVSRRHARILRSNGEVQIEDLGSYNGIRVNNARIAERVSLRVSDQVQIGDYKLYLKAEGVEQVDDARTMPIERVDTANTATDVIAAVSAHVATPVAPPAPQPPPSPMMTPAPGTLAPAAQLVGSPNRTMVAVADTDPQGRPVASAAQVAAVLSSPVGYGKLVVLSSNFAGKEFELSRPQMIIGRTDENDIVINHRSISRNHAKLVRDPETNRYTISDLQSSNGVRVNGQDYGKVELRRGDVVDLGHVRLRFVEGGEDFVFSRDAVITDVPETGGKKSLFIAIGLAALVVVAVVVVMLMRGDKKPNTNGNNLATGTDAGNLIAEAPDAGEAAISLDATAVDPSDPAGAIRVRCKEHIVKQEWPKAIDCSNELKAVDAEEAKKIYTTAHAEEKADAQMRKLDEALKEKSISKAKTAADAIGADSVYRKDADTKYAKFRSEILGDLVTNAKRQAKGDCKGWETVWRQAKSAGTPADIIEEAKGTVPCTPVVAARPDKPDRPDPPDKPDKPDKCANVDDLIAKGGEAFSAGSNAVALQNFEAAYRCKPDAQLLLRTFASACKAKNEAKAKIYWKKMSQGMQNQTLQFCVGNGITIDKLNGS